MVALPDGISPYDALELIRKAKAGSKELSGLVYHLRLRIESDAEFAEALVEERGVVQLLDMMKTAEGTAKGYFLNCVCSVLLYMSGLQELLLQPDIVERIWRICAERDGGDDPRPVILIARPAVQILIVTVKYLGTIQQSSPGGEWIKGEGDRSDPGRKAVHRAAKRLDKEGLNCYKTLGDLIDTNDMDLVTNVLGLMNILFQRTKSESNYKAKKLAFRWHQCGLLDRVYSMKSEDATLRKLIEALTTATKSLKLPQCWKDAVAAQRAFDGEKAAYDAVSKEVFLFQQQQGKLRDARASIIKCQETARALSLQLGLSPNYHPTKRFANGGGIAIPSEAAQAAPVEVHNTLNKQELAEMTEKAFDAFKGAGDFGEHVEMLIGPTEVPHDEGSESEGMPPSDDSSVPPPSSSEDGTDDSGITDSDTDSDSSDFPSSSESDADGGVKTTKPKRKDKATKPKGPAPADKHVDPASPAGDEAGASTAPPTDSKVSSGAAPSVGGKGSKGAAVGGGAAPMPGAPPPPPAPKGAGKKGGKAGKGKAGKGGGKAPKIKVDWWKGGKPKDADTGKEAKMRALHWEKYNPMDEKATGTVWNTVHFGGMDCSFDMAEFVKLFKQPTKAETVTGVKKLHKKTELMEAKKFQNISIMLHKMPPLDDILAGIELLDEEKLPEDALGSIIGQIPKEEDIEMFNREVKVKEEHLPQHPDIEKWEPPELFFKMIIEYGTDLFAKRANSWMFKHNWVELVQNFQRPLRRLREAVDSMHTTTSLPFVLGVLLNFGNMMNAGTKKGDAPAFAFSVLANLEAARDKSGKVNLLQYLTRVSVQKNEATKQLAQELKPTMGQGVDKIKYDDLDKQLLELQAKSKDFNDGFEWIYKQIQAQGKEGTDPYVPKMQAFKDDVARQIAVLQNEYEALKAAFVKVTEFWGLDDKYVTTNKVQPQAIIAPLIEFLGSYTREVDAIDAEQKATAKKNQRKAGDKLVKEKAMEDVVNSITDDMISS